MSLDSFVPTDQPAKLALIAEGAKIIGPAINPKDVDAPPTDAENVESLKLAVTSLRGVIGNQTGPAATTAKRLADAMDKLANASQQVRDTVQATFVMPLQIQLAQLRGLVAGLGDHDGQSAEGTGRYLEIERRQSPRSGAAERRSERQRYVAKVCRQRAEVEPNAVGGPISILRSGDTIVTAFVHAGFWALLSISLLLWLVLRRVVDVLLTIVPLLVAGAVTLEICVLIGLPLNFANIIALPLLLGVGVAFKIYYITAWRSGRTNLLQSSLTRAIFFSALTTATAFGSLCFSSHPGTASMGKLLALSFVVTLAAVLLFQPALMGKPRETHE